MENLISKSVTFEGLLAIFENDENVLFDFITNLKYEDAPFVAETIKNSKKIGKLNKLLHFYVIHEQSETTVRNEKIFDIIKIIDMIRKSFKSIQEAKDVVDKLTVRIITNYTIQQRNQENIKTGMEFINEAFSYLEKEVPDYKDNKYFVEKKMNSKQNFAKLTKYE